MVGRTEGLHLNSNSKINIVGSAGSGKTTLAKYLSQTYGLKRIELDAVFWKPNWTESSDKEFSENVKTEIDGNVGWIVDGGTPVREVFWHDLDVVIWLDYSLPLIIYRISKRTFLRIFITKEKICGENRETIMRQYFSTQSILWSNIIQYWAMRKFLANLLDEPRSAHIKVYRMRSPKELSLLITGSSFQAL